MIGEALSAGLPVVSYDCVAGPSDMIENGANGFLIPVGDKYTFKQKLSLLMEEEELRKEMAKNSRIRIKDYSVDKVAEKFYEFIL